MINLYTQNDLDYTKNGTAVLQPTECTVSEQAGGSYELSLRHPLDPRGIWKLIRPGNIIKAPVPVATIESAISGENVDIYRVTNSGAAIRAKPSAPTRITYQAWYASVYVPSGEKVTFENQNYQSILSLYDQAGLIPPPQYPTGWQEIPNYTSGSPALTNPAVGDELYLVSVYNAYWYYVQDHKGVQGYIQKSYVEYVRTEQVEEIPERTVSEQLFRVYEINVETQPRTLQLRARQVSYDLAGNLVKDCAITAAEPAVAFARLRAALLYETDSTIATNLDETAGKFSGDFSWKNPINALLDPDGGLVSYFKAKLIRDNWDIFLNKNTSTDRGVRLRYGANLRGVTWKRTSDRLINRIMPEAQKANGEALHLPEVWIDSPILETYPVINTEHLKINGKIGGDDGDGGTWTEETLLEHMREQSERRFSVDNADKVSVELSVDFTLLGDTQEYRQYAGLQKLFLYDQVSVIDPVANIDARIQVASYEWDAIRQRYSKMTLASVFDYGGRDVSTYNLRPACVSYDKLSSETINRLKEALS